MGEGRDLGRGGGDLDGGGEVRFRLTWGFCISHLRGKTSVWNFGAIVNVHIKSNGGALDLV